VVWAQKWRCSAAINADAAADDNKKRIFKELGASDFADLAAYYSTLK
jgi:hypothetical protein